MMTFVPVQLFAPSTKRDEAFVLQAFERTSWRAKRFLKRLSLLSVFAFLVTCSKKGLKGDGISEFSASFVSMTSLKSGKTSLKVQERRTSRMIGSIT